MKFKVTYHIYWDTRVEKYFDQIFPLLEKYFENKIYGDDIEVCGLCLKCTTSYDVHDDSDYEKK